MGRRRLRTAGRPRDIQWTRDVRRRLLLLAAGPLLVLALLAARPEGAAADLSFCPVGEGAGQCGVSTGDAIGGVAVDSESGRIYVADLGNNRVDVFKLNGSGEAEFLLAWGWGVADGTTAALQTCTATCFKGIAGAGAGQFRQPRRIAVDNVEGSASRHDVYVFDGRSEEVPDPALRVQKFSPDGELLSPSPIGSKGTGPGQIGLSGEPIAVGPGGKLYVGDTQGSESEGFKPRIEVFDPASGALLEECELPHADRLNGDIAVDGAGDVYAAFNKGGGIFKFHALPGCAEYGSPFPLNPSFGAGALAVAGGELYAAGPSKGVSRIYRVINRFDLAGNPLRRYGFGAFNTTVSGIAPFATSFGDVFASEDRVPGEAGPRVKYLAEPPPGPVIADATAHKPLGSTKATLEAEIDPEDKATTYHFDYTTLAEYEEDREGGGDGFEGPGAKSTPPTALPGAADFELHPASAQIGCPEPLSEIESGRCLFPGTGYRFRLVAENADGEGNSPAEGAFTTAPSLEILQAYAAAVGTDSARLSAEVNPLGVPAGGYFEIATEQSFQEGGFAGAAKVPAGAPFDFGSGEAGITRSAVVQLSPATSYRYRFLATDPLLGEPVASETRALRTFAPAAAGEACPANEAFRSGPSALLPDCRAYELVSPLAKEGGDVAVLPEGRGRQPAVLSQAALDGDRVSYGSYRGFSPAEAAPYSAQFIASRGAAGWSSEYATGPRGRLDIRSTSTFETELKALSPDLCQGWFRSVAEPKLAPGAVEGEPNLYRRAYPGCGAGGFEALTTVIPPHEPPLSEPTRMVEVQGTSADGARAIYAESDNLTPEAPDLNGEGLGLYYQEAGEGSPHFVCILPDGSPVSGSCAAGTTNEVGGPLGRVSSITGALSANGSRVFFSTPVTLKFGPPGKIYLRENPGAEQSFPGDCKEAEAGKACTSAVSAEGEEISGTSGCRFWAAAKDGSAAIFSCGEDLYRYDVASEATTPIAHKVVGVMGESADLSRVYLDSKEALSGANLQGKAPVAGKDNLYLYEAGAGFGFIATTPPLRVGEATSPFNNSWHVTPDGRHAAFMSKESLTGYDNTDANSSEADAEVYLYDATGGGELLCASCNPTGGRPAGQHIVEGPGAPGDFWAAAYLPVWKSSLYPGTFLSEDGSRLYFQSPDALVARDANGAMDVYQWEAPGGKGCDTAKPTYSAQDGGCVDLVSSGQSPGESLLADADPSGSNVFFTTAASLLAQDYGLVDLYDARVDGGLPEPQGPAPGCEGEACQGPYSPPQDKTPASSSFEGAGNVREAKAKKQKHKRKHHKPKKHKRKHHKPKKHNAHNRQGGNR